MDSDLRALPSVDALLMTPEADRLRGEFNADFITAEARKLVAEWRAELRAGRLQADELAARLASAGAELAARTHAASEPSLEPVINATGVVVHTNLGRAPWPQAAIDGAVRAARGYCNLEYDLARGRRGKREAHLARAARCFGAEAALVVNNCAAAVFLTLNTLARDREVIVSRGELVEIGGSFRIPDIMARSGAELREVGTTNRTRSADYAAAIGEQTALILKVHPSNYEIRGFTEAADLTQLARLARDRGVLLVEDLGSGLAVDLGPAGVPGEPTVAASLAAGADLVMFSGDKLLGGPQAGILVGRSAVIEELERNPLYRALRPDKVTIAALEAMFRLFEAHEPWRSVPVLAAIALTVDELEPRARRLARAIAELGYQADVVMGNSTVGGGAAPGSELPSPQIAVARPGLSPQALERALRRHRPPIIARVTDDSLRLDLRTVGAEQEERILAALRAAAA